MKIIKFVKCSACKGMGTVYPLFDWEDGECYKCYGEGELCVFCDKPPSICECDHCDEREE